MISDPAIYNLTFRWLKNGRDIGPSDVEFVEPVWVMMRKKVQRYGLLLRLGIIEVCTHS